ncbi:hypothetical protein TrLO_g8145 [Triparma laevis f. longispina]|uniref:Uncharacterized protein n=1 Tax=Triparma laevis f. longispina TaxID=1714387 RepID=A0A9W7F4H6_9STRA|nr:hypothetical protein TrLO_g8145 [Triparma laevis f. longispina]
MLLQPVYANFHVGDLGVVSNDGVASAVYYQPNGNVGGRRSSVGDLSDAAIDELFPPTDAELQELECVDQFNELLAYMDFMEQHAGIPEFCQLKKRWSSAHKEEPPKGPKPNPTFRYADPPHQIGASTLRVVKVERQGPRMPEKGNRTQKEEKQFWKQNAPKSSMSPRKIRGKTPSKGMMGRSQRVRAGKF